MEHTGQSPKVISKTLRGVVFTLVAALCISACPVNEVQAAKASITITNVGSKHTLKKGEKKTLKVKTKGVSKKNKKKIKYKTSNKKVVTVSSKGKMTAKKNGSATITVYIPKTKLKKTVKVKVGTKVSSLKRKTFPSKKTLYVGTTYQSAIKVSPSKASNKTLKWTSSNPNVAKVNSKGVITAVDNGASSSKATITATTTDGTKKKISCVVTVKRYVSAVNLSSDALFDAKRNAHELIVGDKANISVSCEPANATKKSVTYEGDKVVLNDEPQDAKDVLRVCTKNCQSGAAGTVIALKKGTVNLRVSAADGGGASSTLTYRVYHSIADTKTKVIAHRGMSNDYLENTVTAFKAAANEPLFYGIEADVYDTKYTHEVEQEVNVDVKEKAPQYSVEELEGAVEQGIIQFDAQEGPNGTEIWGHVTGPDEDYQISVGEEARSMDLAKFEEFDNSKKASLIYEHSLKDVKTFAASEKPEATDGEAYVACLNEIERQRVESGCVPCAKTQDVVVGTRLEVQKIPTIKKDIMVMHDKNIKRMCTTSKSITGITRWNRDKYPVKNVVNGRYDHATPEPIPTFDEYLASCVGAGGRKMPVIEIKGEYVTEDALYRMCESLKNAGYSEAYFISFDEPVIQFMSSDRAKQIAAMRGIRYELMYLTASSDIEGAMEVCDNYGVTILSIKSTVCTEETVEMIHDNDIKVGVWSGAYNTTYDTRMMAARFADYGVEYLTTGLSPQNVK